MNQLTELRPKELQANSENPIEMMGQGGVDIWGIVSRRKWLLVFGMVLGLGLGYIYLLQADSIYESKARVLVQTNDRPVSLGLDGISGYEGQRGESNHPIIITSPRIIIDAYEKSQLEKLGIFVDAPEALKQLSENLTVTPYEEAPDVFDITFRATDPDDVRKVVEAVLKSYREFLQRTYQKSSNETRVLFERAQEDLAKKLEKLEQEYQEFQVEAPMFWRGIHGEAISIPERHQQTYDAQRLALQQQITEIDAKIAAIEASLKAGGNLEAILITAGETARDLTHSTQARRDLMIRDRLLPLQFKLEELMTRYGDEHPNVLSVTRQIEQFHEMFPEIESKTLDRRSDEELKKMVADYLDALRQQRFERMSEKAAVEKLYTNEEELARKLAVHKGQDQNYQSQIERTKKLFDSVITNLAQMEMVSDDYDGFKYEELGAPTLGEKVAPMAIKVIPVSAILGLMAGFGLAYLIDVSDKAFRTPDEVSKILQLPLVGHVPLIDIQKIKVLPNSKLQPILVTVHKPKSPQAEAYRAIRTALYFNSRDARHQVIQVTSPMPGDGKSTLSTNLAVTIAQSGKSVLLVDADFRRPTLHKVFGLEKPNQGIAGVVGGEFDPADVEISFPEIPNLKFMPCGARPNNPSELLSSQQFHDTLQMFREQFDFVIVDTPPVLAVSDPCCVAARVDGVIMTFRIHKRARPLATRARDALQDIGANIFGVVVNGVDQEAGGYYSQYRYGFSGYRYAYNYRYGYGYGQYGTYGSEKSESQAINKYFDEGQGQIDSVATTKADND